jgi:predicted transcriptional regulator
MKKISALAILLAISITGKAQIVKELSQQKQTQIEYLANQIAALKVYIQVLQKGYKIADQGLTLIGNIKDGDFKMHKDYFASLRKIKPAIRNQPRIKDIIDLQLMTLQTCNEGMRKAKEGELFSPAEIDYMQKVYQRLLDDCSNKLSELTAVTTEDKLEMKDDERIKRIESVFAAMQDNYTFGKGFSRSAMIMGLSRKKDMQSAATIQQLQNIR